MPFGRIVCLVFFTLFASIYGQKVLAEYTIGPEDVIRILVYDYDDLKTETRVSEDGRITFPLLGELTVGGKTTFKIEQMISQMLSKGGYIKDAQVTVTVVEYKSKRVSVLGLVNAPGRYPLDSITTLIDVIAMAGGIQPTGEEKAIITRIQAGKTSKIEVDLHEQLNISEHPTRFELQAGDVVYIPKAPVFYIYGEVQRPGEYPVERDISVVKALSIGGGLTTRGTQDGIIIKRKNSQGVINELNANLTDNVNKDDVIYVKERLF